jgi:hypothetical protein
MLKSGAVPLAFVCVCVFYLFQAIKQRKKNRNSLLEILEEMGRERREARGERTKKRTNARTTGKEKERNNGKDAEGSQPVVGRKINQE